MFSLQSLQEENDYADNYFDNGEDEDFGDDGGDEGGGKHILGDSLFSLMSKYFQALMIEYGLNQRVLFSLSLLQKPLASHVFAPTLANAMSSIIEASVKQLPSSPDTNTRVIETLNSTAVKPRRHQRINHTRHLSLFISPTPTITPSDNTSATFLPSFPS